MAATQPRENEGTTKMIRCIGLERVAQERLNAGYSCFQPHVEQPPAAAPFLLYSTGLFVRNGLLCTFAAGGASLSAAGTQRKLVHWKVQMPACLEGYNVGTDRSDPL